MPKTISIRTWTEPFPSAAGVAVVFDIFRCSTTIHCLMGRGDAPLFVAPSITEIQSEERLKEMRVFSELSQTSACRERFDNSPHFALTHAASPRAPSLVATTSGTPAMFAARKFRRVYVGSFNNFSALVGALAALDEDVTLIPACRPEWDHVEDEIAAQAVATALEGFSNIPDFVRQCGTQARERILASPRPKHLAGKIPTGAEDVRIALDLDRYDHVLSLEFGDHPLFAEVVKERR